MKEKESREKIRRGNGIWKDQAHLGDMYVSWRIPKPAFSHC